MTGGAGVTLEELKSLPARELRLELEGLYAGYVACIDNDELELFPEFFCERCVYKIQPRTNFERGLPLATWLSESRGMLKDRVTAIRQLSTYGPRYLRHVVSAVRVLGWDGDALRCEANYAVFETLPDELTRVFQVGRYLDRVVVDEGRLRFAEKLCVFDSELIPNTLVYPI